MGYRKYLLCIVFSVLMLQAKAQADLVRKTDSISFALYQDANWKQLIDFGKQSLDSHIDFPLLRLRIAYAFFVTNNFGEALAQYENVIAHDHSNQTARYYGYLCNKYLNRSVEASNFARFLKKETFGPGMPTAFGLIDAGLESSFKLAETTYRGNGSYNRVFLSNRLIWKLQLEQSAAYYNQPIYYIFRKYDRDRNYTENILSTGDHQSEYFFKLSYPLTNDLVILGSYHYLNANYQQTTYQNNVGLLGLKFYKNYYDLQADVAMGDMIGEHLGQFNARVGIYPMGNLNLYAFSRVSYLQNTSAAVFDQTIGFKAVKNLWIEGSATFGKLDNYLDSDGLYVYDSVDVTRFKTQSTAFIQLTTHTMLQITYTFEKKNDENEHLDYNQNSITAGLQWKF